MGNSYLMLREISFVSSRNKYISQVLSVIVSRDMFVQNTQLKLR